VFIAPLLPYLTDSTEQITALVSELADAGVTGVSGIGLHLRPGAREWFFTWLQKNRPDLVEPYQRLYSRGANLPVEYRRELSQRIRSISATAGIGQEGFGQSRSGRDNPVTGVPGDRDASFPPGSLPESLQRNGSGDLAEPLLF
jgi:DNA repair photolyase